MSFLVTLQAAAAALALAAAPPTVAASASGWNRLQNPGFEQGREGWIRLGGAQWGDFDVVEGRGRRGGRAARLRPEWPSGALGGTSTKVFGVVQEPAALERLPATLSGWYRVDDWWSESPQTSLYLQVVVIVFGDPEVGRVLGRPSSAGRINNYQIRYYLGGAAKPAFELLNARIRMVSVAQPRIGEWVRFELPVAADFEELWSRRPEGFEGVRVLFEARWDGRPPGAGVRAEVLYDDLAFGDPPAQAP